jgi:DNA-binding MarR family transcriptional regulator
LNYDPSMGSDRTAAWSSLLRAHAAVLPKLARELADVGLPISWYDVLLVLNSAPGRRLRMSELGTQAVISREQVSRVVSALEAAGLVERQRNPDDGRSAFAVITADGRKRLRTAAPAYLAAIEEHFTRHLSETEIYTIAKALGRVLTAEQASGPAGSPQ